MSGKRGFHYTGPVADSPEVRAENEVLEAFGLNGSTIVPREIITGLAEEDVDSALLARSRPLGGISIGKETYEPIAKLLSRGLSADPPGEPAAL
jgi:hypothetical protein